ncbi:hypothetical protein ACFSR7_14490 [Cohnella sp. GCM10020058]|uniref:hypothetical protein n=1 Tax=Cohnella sp. GCM10020058 TaxID=3317330 RepID=UPI00363FBD18
MLPIPRPPMKLSGLPRVQPLEQAIQIVLAERAAAEARVRKAGSVAADLIRIRAAQQNGCAGVGGNRRPQLDLVFIPVPFPVSGERPARFDLAVGSRSGARLLERAAADVDHRLARRLSSAGR